MATQTENDLALLELTRRQSPAYGTAPMMAGVRLLKAWNALPEEERRAAVLEVMKEQFLARAR